MKGDKLFVGSHLTFLEDDIHFFSFTSYNETLPEAQRTQGIDSYAQSVVFDEV